LIAAVEGADDSLIARDLDIDDNINIDDLGADELSLASIVDAFSSDSEDLFSEALKCGLNPLALEELRTLTDTSVIADPDTEDLFRFDPL